MNLTTIERCKVHLAGYKSSDDALLSQLVADVSAVVEGYLDRGAMTQTRTEYFDVRAWSYTFQLKAYPIVSVASVHNDEERVYPSTSLIASTDYAVQLEYGQIVVDRSYLSVGPRALKVVYDGGMGTTTATFIAAFPEVERAVRLQVVEEFVRRNTAGANAQSVGSGSVSFVGQLVLLEYVRDILERYRNRGGQY